MSQAHFLVGIDLGTTHTVVAFADLRGGLAQASPQLFEIPQTVAPGEVAARPLLPSLRYHPLPGELAEQDLALPWTAHTVPGDMQGAVFGVLAQHRAAQVEGRSVVSAKSWLCHDQVDRSASILPWGADDSVPKVSPVVASASYLAQVRAAWNHAHPQAPLEQQDVVITVPASFDEAARALTVDAARLAGLASVRLLEEPQAVCYDWYARHRQSAATELASARLLLVVDVGGGTTDLSLIRIDVQDGELALTRIGVGDHLMLGGDNMDLTLARHAEMRLTSTPGKPGSRLSVAALAQLVAQCRQAKEQLLAEHAPEQVSVTVLGSGARLIGASRTLALTRDEVQHWLLDGFLPKVAVDAPLQGADSAVVAFGLPYARDPAITRHISAFLRAHQTACRQALQADELAPSGWVIPDAVLVNGGVFNSAQVRERLRAQLADWSGQAPRWLDNGHPDLAVAFGAVAYGMARRGAFRTIRSGAARSIFLRLPSEGERTPLVCLLPKGSEEGREVRLEGRRFLLRVGEPVQFHLVTSGADTVPQAGELSWLDDHFASLPPLVAVLPAQGKAQDVSVELAARLTEVGTIEIDAIADDNQRWQVEFQMRRALREQQGAAALQNLPASVREACALIDAVYGARRADADPQAVKQLRTHLERLLGTRQDWDMGVARALADALLEGARNRRRSAAHERLWCNLLGFCLRPGFGHPLDAWRMEQLWALYPAGLQYATESQAWAEWWTLWRRVSGGLDESAQLTLYADVAKFINPAILRQLAMAKDYKLKSYDDMARLVASLEALPAAAKREAGDWLLKRLEKAAANDINWWCLGRIGARVPFHANAHRVLAPEDAARWTQRTLKENWSKARDAAFAAVMLVRPSGDRARDVDEALRLQVRERLLASKAPDSWVALVEAVTHLDEAASRRVFGEALPVGLRLAD